MKIEAKNYPWTFIFKVGLKKTFGKIYAWPLTIFAAINVLFLYYFLMVQKTTWDAFWQSNTRFYVWGQITLSVLNAILIGVALTMIFAAIEERRKASKMTYLQTFSSLLFSAAATGCSVCSAFLLPLLGIAASLTALPFGGLEVKFLSALLLLYSIYENAKINSGLCPLPKDNLIESKGKKLEFRINKNTLPQLKPFLLLTLFLLIIYLLPRLPSKWRIRMQKDAIASGATGTSKAAADLFARINPPKGYEINATFGDIGPKMIEMGVIDEKKFKDTYSQSGQSLPQELSDVLTKGSNQKIKITPENSYFLLNFFWAFGLANQTKILTEGDMIKYGEGQTGNFASTGGWTLTKSGNAMDYYSTRSLAPLTPEQEKLVESVASNVYRPCCGNPTSFPDCNHGMALLGIFELMASQGATEKEMYEAAKYINSFWFPANAYDTAMYFKNKEGLEFEQIDGKKFLSKDTFSAFGAEAVKKWLVEKNLAQPPPKQGGGCGV